METVKRLFISLLVLLGCSAGAWAIEQDSDGYYLIGSVQDWQDFAAIVETTNDANAKMIADVDLGDDQTHIGSMAQNGTTYKGTFDGQGYTLTVAYVGGSRQIVAPFTNVQGATIKNLHVDGSISSVFAFIGVVGYVRGSGSVTTVSNVWNSATMSIQTGEWAQSGAIVGGFNNGSVVITDCLFTGSFTTNQGGYCGCFTGYTYSAGSITQTNCLSTGTFSMSGTGFRGTHSNCYVSSFPASFPSGVAEATAEGISDGTITTALGDGWAQDPLTHQPVPKIFTTVQDEDGNYLIGSVQDWKRFAAIVETTPNANAKMTADVDLGDDQTMVGIGLTPNHSNVKPFSGIFDGQGHTLTVAYTGRTNELSSPFQKINGATIKKLHVTGTIESLYAHAGGIVSQANGSNNVMSQCWSSVEINATGITWNECGGLVGNMDGSMTISDCLFSGTITCDRSYNGCFVGYVQQSSNSTIITNCLSTGTFTYSGNGNGFPGTNNNCYVYQFPTTIPAEMQVTDDDISDGTTATALQADRSEEIWVQDPVLGIPMLKIFANEETEQPSEALNGVFTINASGEKVSFAKGNLQKIGSTYQFAEHQYDYFGTNQSDTHRDMYAFLAYSNPDNGESWSMLSRDEWKYLFATRSVTNTLSDGARYTMATIGDTYKGLIIFPDYYTHPEGTGFTPGVFNSNSNYTAKVSLEGWAMMEAAGCVFLPAAGYCSLGSTWTGVGEYVCYMSSTPDGSNNYYDPYFTPNSVNLYESSSKRTWSSIRLVLRLQPLTYTVPASGVGTFSSDVNIHLPEGLNAHYCKTYYAERSAISVVNISSGVVPANTGVLLSGTPGETFNLYPTPETAGELEGNALVAVTKPVHISPTKGDYTNFMMKGGKFIKIADESYTVKMPAHRAYLPLLTSAISGSNAKEIMLYWDDEETTGVERMRNVENERMRNGNIYNLNGQKLSAPQKGINIINGRKVIVK